MPPGWRAPGALRDSGEDWTWPHTRRRVAVQSATEKPARVPRELRCERSQQPRGTPLLCPVSPPSRPKPRCRTRGVADAGEGRCGQVRFPRTVQSAGARVHAWRTVPAWSASQKVERVGFPRTGTLPHGRITLGKLPFCLVPYLLRPFRWDQSPHSELECILPPRAPMGGCDPGRAGMSH